MRNYGEVLAYWYLRLNGFFLLTDFVLHQGALLERTSDCDILAVRFSHTYEEIGGQRVDWDDQLFREIGFDLDAPRDQVIGLIVQVKTGSNEVGEAFSDAKLTMAVQRLGFFSDEEIRRNEVIRRLASSTTMIERNYFLAKLAILKGKTVRDDDDLYFVRSLEHIRQFIKRRMSNYQRKYGDRLFFSDPLIQYIAGLESRERGDNV